MLIGVAAAEFGVGGDGQVALGAGGGVPVGAVGHDRGEDGLALPVGLVQGLVAGRERLLPGGVAGVAAGAAASASARARMAARRAWQAAARTWRSSSPTYWGAQAVSMG